ncbi:hypothetical protein FGG08_003792 [Glutinoglossum americanum]|uniref:F-box domain-containing protein n=1 Tax=Glutinoglossum americanum TaxID=1670608 RepID=A0A9P8I1T9_9PEZI|nr:hypothetical protein FGG08_003792 [Glutinoglossum americanum]
MNLLIEIARHLTVNALVRLYSVSRDFHAVVDTHMTTVVMHQAFIKCSDGSRIFPHTTYKSLCILDPSGRPNPEAPNEVRMVPSFRWLRMLMFREGVVRKVMAQVHRLGHKLPPRAALVLKKLWFMMDICVNENRARFIRNRKFWSNLDLYIATLFFIKLDMCFTDPSSGSGETHLRRLLLGQRSLSLLLKVLQRDGVVSQLDLIQLFIGYSEGVLPDASPIDMFGVHKGLIGKKQLEGWGLGPSKLLRVDEIVMIETVRRELGFDLKYPQMMIWGYLDPDTLEAAKLKKKAIPVGDETDEEEDVASPIAHAAADTRTYMAAIGHTMTPGAT